MKELLSKLFDPAADVAALVAAELQKAQQAAAAIATTARPSTAPQAMQLPQPGQLTMNELVYVAVRALKLALMQPQYQSGFVLDGLKSKHLPHPVLAARCLLLATGLENKALQQAGSLSEPAAFNSTSGSGSASVGKGKDKAPSAAPKASSRPGSSKSGRGAALLEPPNPILDCSKQDLWEGCQEVGLPQ